MPCLQRWERKVDCLTSKSTIKKRQMYLHQQREYVKYSSRCHLADHKKRNQENRGSSLQGRFVFFLRKPYNLLRNEEWTHRRWDHDLSSGEPSNRLLVLTSAHKNGRRYRMNLSTTAQERSLTATPAGSTTAVVSFVPPSWAEVNRTDLRLLCLSSSEKKKNSFIWLSIATAPFFQEPEERTPPPTV